jgi:hypothetical protein
VVLAADGSLLSATDAGRRWLDALGHLRALAVSPRRYSGAFIGMALYLVGDIVSFWAGLRVFGLDLRIAAAILAFATGYALTRRTLPLAGAGITAVLLAYSVLWAGGPLAPAVPGVFAYQLFSLWLPTLAALLPWRVLRSGVLVEGNAPPGSARKAA